MDSEELDSPYLHFRKQTDSTWKILSNENEIGLIKLMKWYQSKFQIDLANQSILVESGSVLDWVYHIMKEKEDMGDIKMSYTSESTISLLDQNFKSDTFLVRPPTKGDEEKYYVLRDEADVVYLFSEIKFNKMWGYPEEIITYRTDEEKYDDILSEVSTYFFVATYLHIYYVLSSM